MSPWTLFLYFVAIAAGVSVVGLALRGLKLLDLTVKAALMSPEKRKEKGK